MDFVIEFFRDVLDGPVYITIVVINSILICSCIGYLGDIYVRRKKAKEKFDSTYATIDNNSGVNVSSVQTDPQTMQPQQITNNNQTQ